MSQPTTELQAAASELDGSTKTDRRQPWLDGNQQPGRVDGVAVISHPHVLDGLTPRVHSELLVEGP